MDIANILYTASIWVLPAVFAITLHEAAHGFVAWRLGDDTAYRQGRVTFNPLRHIDPVGTILVPALLLLSGVRFLFGWAKPVPVNFSRLQHPKRDMIWVAAAGPGINLILAFFSALALHVSALLPGTVGQWTDANLVNSVQLNVMLAVFNMLPIPPLDGGRVLVGILPSPLARPLARLERIGLFIILGGLFILPLLGQQLGLDLNIFDWLVGEPATFLLRLIVGLTGLE